LRELETLINKGDQVLSEEEREYIRNKALAIQAFEQAHYRLPKPTTLRGMIELKMYERGMNRSRLAELLGIGLSKVSDILNGKRKPDVTFLKAAHQKLGIDAEFLLRNV